MAETSILLRLKLDEPTARRAEQGIKRIRAEVRGVGPDARSSAGDLNELNKSLRKLEDVNEKSRQAIGDFSTFFGAGGSVLGGSALGGVGDIFGLVEYIPLAAKGLGALTPQMAGLAAGTVALSGALALFDAANRQASVSVNQLMSTQEAFYRALATGSREQVEAALEAAQLEADIQRARIQENRDVFARFEQEAGVVGRALSDVLDIAGTRRLREATQELEGELASTEFLIRRYQSALEDGTQITEDAAEAERQLAAIRERRGNIELDTLVRADQLTAQQRNERIEAILREREIIAQYIQTVDLSDERGEALIERMRDLGAEMEALESVSDSYADQLDRQRIAQERLTHETQSLFDALEEETRLKQAAFEGTQAYNRAVAENTANLARINAEATAAIAENEAQAQEQREEQAEEHQERLNEIQRKSNAMIANAVAERDALAAFLAKQQRSEELQEEQKANEKRLQEIDKALQKQNEAVNRRLEERLASERERSEREISIIRDRNQQILVDLQNASNAVIAMQQQSASVLQQAAVTAFNTGVSIATNLINAVLTTAQNLLSRPSTGTFGPVTGNALPTNTYIQTPTGPIGPNGIQPYGPPTPVYSSPSMGGGINITVNGTSSRQIRQEVDRRLAQTLQAAGFAA